ncbi:MAG TPA: serine/threonine-protein kinase [Gaiellaceae bacterium]
MSAYRVERELGRGGMAVVYEARQEELDRPVALKVLAAHLAGNDEFRTRFLREARIAGRLHHPHLARTYDIAELDGLPCIVMELLPGGTLEGGRLTRDEAADVAEALAYAHAAGVVHRDLKPANLLRGAHGEVKIADFGIARAAEETMVTQVGTVLGTLRYLAPEQAEGRVVGPEADVYSLGVVFDELLPDRDAITARMRAADPAARPTATEVAAYLRGATVVRRGARHRKVSDTSWVAAAAIGVLVAAVLLATHDWSKKPASVRPVPHAASTTQQARNLEAWLRSYSR